MGETNETRRGVPLSPSTMIDSVADWPLHRVVEHLRKKEKEDKAEVDMDCRLFHTSSISLFFSVVDELAEYYGVSRGRICRWLSYHGAAIAKEDSIVGELGKVHSQVRRSVLKGGGRAVAGIQSNCVPYAPESEESGRFSMYVYNTWVLSDFTTYGVVCGVAPFQAAQVYMARSILTCDLPIIGDMAAQLREESAWWDRWMRYRSGSLQMGVAMWGAD